MKKFLKPVFVLAVISLITGLMLSFSYYKTKDKIEYIQRQEVLDGFNSVLPYHNNEPDKDAVIYNGAKIYIGKDNGTVTGYGINIISTSGYSGSISVLTGIDINGKISGVSIVYHSETPGLGDKITGREFLDSFKGMGLGNKIAVKKDGGEIEQFSGATISPRAVAKAVNDSIVIVSEYMKREKND